MIWIRLISGLALVGYGCLLWLVRSQLHRREVRSFFLFLVAMLAWQLGVTGVTLTSDPTVALGWYRVTLGLGATFGIFYAQFTRDLLGIRRHRWTMLLGYTITGGFGAWTLAGGPYVINGIDRAPSTGLLLPGLGSLTFVSGVVVYTALIFSLVALAKRRRTSPSALERNRLDYLILGILLVFLGSTINFSTTLKGFPLDMVANILNAILIAYAMLRYQLLDVSLVIRKGLAYSIPTTVIGAGYLLMVLLATSVLSLVTGYRILLASLILAAVTAVAVEPLRDRVQSAVDRRFFREKYDANRMLQSLSRTTAAVLDLNRLGDIILDEIVGTMHIERAAIVLKRGESATYYVACQRGAPEAAGLTLQASHPIILMLARLGRILSRQDVDVLPQFAGLWRQERAELDRLAADLFVPLQARGQLIGILVIGPKLSEASYTSDELRVLETLSNTTAVAIQNAWLHQAVLKEKEIAETIVRETLAGIVLVDAEMRIIHLNPHAESITGYTAAEADGKRLDDVWRMEAGDHGVDLLAHALDDQIRVGPAEARIVGKNGPRDILLGITPTGHDYLLSFADITRLKEADRLKSNIVANVSHELRAPLASIKAYAELLLDDVADASLTPELRQRFLAVIDRETDRLTDLITDFLDLSRLEAGHFELRTVPLAIREVVEDSIALLEVQARERDVTVVPIVPANLPPIEGDSRLLTILVKNLISNAIKFSNAGGRIEITAGACDGQLTLEVSDEGLGIPKDELPSLFEKFHRSRIAKSAGIGGTGLGLVLAKEAAEAHGGSIAVESAPGVGTTFTVTLPVMDDLFGPELMPASGRARHELDFSFR